MTQALSFDGDVAEFHNEGEGRCSIFVQLWLCLLEQFNASFVGGFEDFTADIPFELLSGEFDLRFDLFEFVVAVVDDQLQLKGSDGDDGLSVVGDFTFGGEYVTLVLGDHGSLLAFL